MKNYLINELLDLEFDKLVNLCKKLKVEITQLKQTALIYTLVKALIADNKLVLASGILDTHSDNFGFLRYSSFDFGPSHLDIYVNSGLIKKIGLKKGDEILVELKSVQQEDKYLSASKVVKLNGKNIDGDNLIIRPHFEDLQADFPSEMFDLTTNTISKEMSCTLRMIELFAPIGKGSRCLIVAGPRVGKTSIVLAFAVGLIINNPNVKVVIVNVGERPEEVTEVKRIIKNADLDPKRICVVSSNFDESASRNTILTDLLLESLKRRVESNPNEEVVMILDSITKMARAFNMHHQGGGKTMTGGLEAAAFQRSKKILGAARKIVNGGSLTIIATALQQTSLKGDDIMTAELLGTCNCNIFLDQQAANMQIFPALDLEKTGTRRYEYMIKDPVRLSKIIQLKKLVALSENKREVLEILRKKIASTPNNAALLESIKTSSKDN